MRGSNFYPRPPSGGRLEHVTHEDGEPIISIHALRVEGDSNIASKILSTVISIHALRVEGDLGVGGKMS